MDEASREATIETVKVIVIMILVCSTFIGWAASCTGVFGGAGAVLGWGGFIGLLIAGLWSEEYQKAKKNHDRRRT